MAVTTESHPLLIASDAKREEPGRWTAQVPSSWYSWSGPMGGMLNALAVRVAADVLEPGVVPRTTHSQFLSSASDAPLVLTATVERRGRTSQFVSVRGTQDAEPVFLASVVSTSPLSGPSEQRMESPSVPPPGKCEAITFPPEIVPFGQHFEIRYAGGSLPLEGSAEAEMSAWFRLLPDVPADPLVAMTVLDALPPGLYPTMTYPAVMVAAEITVHMHADLVSQPVDDYVLAVQRNVSRLGASCIDESELWSRSGHLLAQARQLRRILDDDTWSDDDNE